MQKLVSRQYAALHMDTVVQIKVVSTQSEKMVQHAIRQAFAAFRAVEEACSRFDEESELRRLMTQVGTPVRVSHILFEALRFAWEAAHLTNGAFDPSVGHSMEAHGFNRHYLTGEETNTSISTATPVNYLDIVLDEEQQTVQLEKSMVLDLGAVAKGLAIDLAKKELSAFEGFLIDAGGDVYVSGLNECQEPWLVGIRHPLAKNEILCTLKITNSAVCTSGNYERTSTKTKDIHHLIVPQSGSSAQKMVSCTVLAPFAMMADTFSTAAFILGPDKGINLLNNLELKGLCITKSLEVYRTQNIVSGYDLNFIRPGGSI